MEALLSHSIFDITSSMELFDRQRFSEYCAHGGIIKEILGGKNNEATHLETGSNMDPAMWFPVY